MKFFLNDQIKHRIIGGMVVLSCVAMFTPSVFVSSKQKLEHHFHVVKKMPEKPTVNAVETEMTDISRPEPKKIITTYKQTIKPITSAESLTLLPSTIPSIKTAANPPEKTIEFITQKPILTQKNLKKHELVQSNPKLKYVVQLGLFSKKDNANHLIELLRKKGYSASMINIKAKNNITMYKVISGSYVERRKAVQLSSNLFRVAGINSFVISQNG